MKKKKSKDPLYQNPAQDQSRRSLDYEQRLQQVQQQALGHEEKLSVMKEVIARLRRQRDQLRVDNKAVSEQLKGLQRLTDDLQTQNPSARRRALEKQYNSTDEEDRTKDAERLSEAYRNHQDLPESNPRYKNVSKFRDEGGKFEFWRLALYSKFEESWASFRQG